MKYKFGFAFVFFCFSLVSCKEKESKHKVTNYTGFIDSFSEKLKSNSYFGITSIRKVIPFKDTIGLLDPDFKISVQYASTLYNVSFDTLQTVMNIKVYTNIEDNEVKYLKDRFLTEKALEKVSVYVELDNFFCTIVLSDPLNNSTFPYLQNVKIELLEEYIKFFNQ